MTENQIPEPIRQLLSAIADTLELPAPAPTVDAEASHRLLTETRTWSVQGAVRELLSDDPKPDFQWAADYLRSSAEQHPVTYQTRDQYLRAFRAAARIHEEETR